MDFHVDLLSHGKGGARDVALPLVPGSQGPFRFPFLPLISTFVSKDGLVIPLVELSAKQVAFHIPFEVVEKVYPPVPEQLQLRIAFWSFPENEEDIR